jgi:CheY-like chemotaxis protein
MNKDVKVLLIEDNEGDIILTKEAFRSAHFNNDITVVKDGDAALKYFEGAANFESASVPDMILLDINLPKVDGRQVLNYIKNDERWKKIPVMMLTTSEAETDIQYAYQHHANCYIVKPVGFKEFLGVIKKLNDFWMDVVRLAAGN